MADERRPHSPPTELRPRLERIARSLLRDAQEAEDVVQDVWLASLEHPAADYGDARSWFAAVTRNLARTKRRRLAARRHRERARAAPEADDTWRGDRERDAVAQRLLEAVDRLRSPYRETIRAHYLEDVSIADLARRGECPESTVRTRLKRGLDRLRADLGAEFGGPRGFRLALVGGFPALAADGGGAPGAGAAPPNDAGPRRVRLARGGLGPVVALGVVLSVATIAALLVVARQGTAASDTAAEDAIAAASAAGTGTTRTAAPERGDRARAGGRRQPASPATDPTASTPAAHDAASPSGAAQSGGASGTLRIHVVDPFGLPATGAEVLLVDDQVGALRGTTDADGAFALEWSASDLRGAPDAAASTARPPRFGLVARHPHWADSQQTFVAPGTVEDVLRLELRSGAVHVRGTVRDASGRPRAGARVQVRSGPRVLRVEPAGAATLDVHLTAVTDAEGRYALPGLARGDHEIVCRVAGAGVARTAVSLGAERAVERDLVLGPGASLSGVVASAHEGPREGVRVTLWTRSDTLGAHVVSTTDAAGRYRFTDLPQGTFRVTFQGAGIDAFRSVRLQEDRPSTLDLTLGIDRALRVEVVDTEGRPCPDVRVEALAHGARWRVDRTTDAAGRAEVVAPPVPGETEFGKRRVQALAVMVFGPNSGPLPVDVRVLDSVPHEPVRLVHDDDGARLGNVEALLLDHTGAPVEGGRLELYDDPGGKVQDAETSPGGHVRIGPVPPRRFELFVACAHSTLHHVGPITVEPGANDLGTLRLPKPVAVDVDWHWPADRPAATYEIVGVAWLPAGPRSAVTARGDAGGGRHHLLPGEYAVVVRSAEGKALEQRSLWLAPGQDARIRLGPGPPRRVLVRADWPEAEGATCTAKVTWHPWSTFGPNATPAEREAQRASAAPLFVREAERDARGHFVLDYDIDGPGCAYFEFTDARGRTKRARLDHPKLKRFGLAFDLELH